VPAGDGGNWWQRVAAGCNGVATTSRKALKTFSVEYNKIMENEESFTQG